MIISLSVCARLTWSSFPRRCCSRLSRLKDLCIRCIAPDSAAGPRILHLERFHLTHRRARTHTHTGLLTVHIMEIGSELVQVLCCRVKHCGFSPSSSQKWSWASSCLAQSANACLLWLLKQEVRKTHRLEMWENINKRTNSQQQITSKICPL